MVVMSSVTLDSCLKVLPSYVSHSYVHAAFLRQLNYKLALIIFRYALIGPDYCNATIMDTVSYIDPSTTHIRTTSTTLPFTGINQ